MSCDSSTDALYFEAPPEFQYIGKGEHKTFESEQELQTTLDQVSQA